MRIAFLVDQFPSLSETFILNQITGLIDRGHEVDIYPDKPSKIAKIPSEVIRYECQERTYYVQWPNNRYWRLLKGAGLFLGNFSQNPGVLLRSLNIFKYNFSKNGEQAAILKLLYSSIPFLNQQPYDIIHCHYGRNGIRGALLRDIGVLKGKLITTFHGYDVNSYPNQYGSQIYQPLFQTGDFYTVNTMFTAGKAVALGCPENKIVKLPVGVNLSNYTFRERSLRDGDPVNIITVARLVEKKGIEYSIRAIGKLHSKYAKIKYCIVGEGPLRESLERLISELDLGDRVKLLGSKTQQELLELYAQSHIFVLSSVTAANGDQEGQGLVLQEAQATGMPVLSTIHNGIPDGILDGKSGFLVPERDVDALADRLDYLISHPHVWAEMGRAGRSHVEANYDIEKLNDRLVEIYQMLLSENL
jgi:colanic acid/amylovoran biosynthesis glycosyltransferase